MQVRLGLHACDFDLCALNAINTYRAQGVMWWCMAIGASLVVLASLKDSARGRINRLVMLDYSTALR